MKKPSNARTTGRSNREPTCTLVGIDRTISTLQSGSKRAASNDQLENNPRAQKCVNHEHREQGYSAMSASMNQENRGVQEDVGIEEMKKKYAELQSK